MPHKPKPTAGKSSPAARPARDLVAPRAQEAKPSPAGNTQLPARDASDAARDDYLRRQLLHTTDRSSLDRHREGLTATLMESDEVQAEGDPDDDDAQQVQTVVEQTMERKNSEPP